MKIARGLTVGFALAAAAFAWEEARAITIDLVGSFPAEQDENNFSVYGGSEKLELTGEKRYTSPGYPWEIPQAIADPTEIFMHPSADKDIILRYTVQEADTYSLSGRYRLDSGNPFEGDGIRAYITAGGNEIWSGSLTAENGLLSISFTLSNVVVKQGDFLDFGISARDTDTHDWGYLQGTIASTPEPGTLLLLSLGLAGAGGLRLKSRTRGHTRRSAEA